MARPRTEKARQLAQLEDIAALLAAIEDHADCLSLRWRQARRRGLGHPRLLAVLDPMANELHDGMAAALAAHRIVCEMLEALQAERTEANGG